MMGGEQFSSMARVIGKTLKQNLSSKPGSVFSDETLKQSLSSELSSVSEIKR